MKRSMPSFGNDQIRLRLLEKNDLDKTLMWRNRDEVRCCFKHSDVIIFEQHLNWFESYLKKDDDFVFVVEAESIVVGQASVYDIDWEGESAEIGRFLASPEHSGKGYIRSGCQLLIDLCWHQLGLKYLFLEVFQHNTRAIRLYESLGFSQERCSEGLLRFGLKRHEESILQNDKII